ncbi:MAG: 4'-phosphopantetheinyl transferase superfamily protein [Bacteroidetes bacterium]|nr:4'-phosphopantetheinyl transferase superfamily protein [Bacteroidota bacterium]MDA0904130.1 4'-phosphopantetheinyl transferase superfamily protein [Bacteroidota bacterium]MDA1242654.1 4'-phosphopantetheinyl transferase superfamily protein [Bacteroidota bacterium]
MPRVDPSSLDSTWNAMSHDGSNPACQMAIWHAHDSELQRRDLASRFPLRNVDALSTRRQREHHAVACALTCITGTDEWSVVHDEHGAPRLVLGDEMTAPRWHLSLSHHDVEEGVVAAAALWTTGAPGGIDLVHVGDPRLSRVASRFMSDEELSTWRSQEGWVWATKEAMFKGHGPALTFKTDLRVDAISGVTRSHGTTPGLGGSVVGRIIRPAEADSPTIHEWKGRWHRLPFEEGRVVVVWGS